MIRPRSRAVTFVDSNVVTSPQGGGGALDSVTLTYLGTNAQVTGSFTSVSSSEFQNGLLVSPIGAPELTIDQFTFYCNGLLIEKDAIVSFNADEANVSCSLVINTGSLGYVLSSDDEFTAVGKFAI
jgi:hypothetical protein